jgi:hypothetical protein
VKAAGVIIVGLIAFVAALAAFLPATFVDRELDAQTGGRLRFADASGTIWNARGVLTAPASAWRLPIAFTIAKEDIARGVHRVVLQSVDASTAHGSIEVVGDGARVRDLAIEAPAAALSAAMPARGVATFGGTIAVTAGIFDWTASEQDGGINARWRGARLVVGDTIADLGTVEVSGSPRNGQLNGRIANTGGDVRIDGTVVASAAGAVTVDATVAPAASAPPNIARALAAIGSADANGAVRIAWRGTLR